MKPAYYFIVRCIIITALLIPVALGIKTAAQPTFSAGTEHPDIIIDPGHGGVDGGAVGITGSIEKNINLEMSLLLKEKLEGMGYSVLMVRSEDISIHSENAKTIREKKTSDLKNRLKIAKEHPQSLFISIHMNSYPDAGVNGSVLYFGGLNTESKVLAGHIKDSIKLLQPKNKKEMKKAGGNLYLLSNAPNPSVLVECGFISNPTEEKLLKSQEYREKMAQAICSGISSYYGERLSKNIS